MPDTWSRLLLRIRKSVAQRGVCVIDVRLLCSNGKLLFYREPKVTRFEPHHNAPLIEAAMMEQNENAE